ncbi:MAG: oligosaccharide flippase family protein [Candidatus Omnitrophota bacterium]|nr:oligosaccharide flippase family protein [Candidatus Omnitrophota bacterium]
MIRRGEDLNFVKGSVFTIISKGIMFLFSLFISIYVARILGPEAKGMYYILVQLVSIVVLFGMLGINNSAVYFLGKKNMPQAELVTHILFLTILSSIVFFGFTMVSHNFLGKSILKGVPGQYLLIMTFAIPPLMFNQIFLSLILGSNRIIIYNVFEILCYFLLFLNFVIFVVWARFGIYGAYLGFVVTYLLMDCIYIVLFVKRIGLRIEWERIKDIMHYALRGFLAPICLLLVFKIDSFILNIFSDIRQVGFYSIAVSFAELLPFVPLAVGTVLFPKLASQEGTLLNASIARVIRVVLTFILLLGLVFLAFGKWMVLFIYGNTYSSSVIPM